MTKHLISSADLTRAEQDRTLEDLVRAGIEDAAADLGASCVSISR